MKFVMMFLVLSLVVLMAEPGEGFFGHIFKGARMLFRGIRHVRRHRAQTRYRTYGVNRNSRVVRRCYYVRLGEQK